MIGRTYLEKAIPASGTKRLSWAPVVLLVAPSWRKGSPRNCLIERADGTRVVRPFRGLRRATSQFAPSHEDEKREVTA